DGPGQQPFAINSRCCSFGSYGASHGAKRAANTKTPTKTKPTIAPGFRISRCHAPRHSPLGASSWISVASISATLTREPPDDERVDRSFQTAARAEPARPEGDLASDVSRVSNLRVDDRVGDVHDQVDEHEHEGEEQNPALEHRVVAVEDGVSQPGPHSRPREDGLGQDRPREQESRLARAQRVERDAAGCGG